jgi:hypothetical protein
MAAQPDQSSPVGLSSARRAELGLYKGRHLVGCHRGLYVADVGGNEGHPMPGREL